MYIICLCILCMYIDNSNRSDLFARLDEYRASPERIQQVSVQGRSHICYAVYICYICNEHICYLDMFLLL